MGKAKRIFGIAVLLLVFFLCLPFVSLIGRADRFLDHSFDLLENEPESPGIVRIDLTNRSYFVALIEHSCCSGAGFDAVAIRTSEGREYESRKNYCGSQGFYFAMTDLEIQNLSQLDEILMADGYTER